LRKEEDRWRASRPEEEKKYCWKRRIRRARALLRDEESVDYTRKSVRVHLGSTDWKGRDMLTVGFCKTSGFARLLTLLRRSWLW
jgi:hypothetical protein